LTSLQVDIVTSGECFSTLQTEWNDLLDRSTSSSVFLRWEWLYSWWEHFSVDHRLFLVLVRNGQGLLLGIGPFCVVNNAPGLPRKALTFLGRTPASSEYLDIIVDKEYEDEVGTVLCEALLKGKPDWSVLHLESLLPNALIGCRLKATQPAEGYSFDQSFLYESPYLTLPTDEGQLLEQIRPTLRTTIRRKSKKLDKQHGQIDFASTEQVPERMTGLFALHQKCWTQRGQSGNFRNLPVQEFHHSVAQRFCRSGLLRLATLTVAGVPAAHLYGFRFKERFYYYQSGYDPDFTTLSPGTLLMWGCLRQAIADGVETFDFLRGSEKYKALWTDQSQVSTTMILLPQGLSFARFYYFGRKLRSRGATAIRGFFEERADG